MSNSSHLIAEEDDSQGINPWSPPTAETATDGGDTEATNTDSGDGSTSPKIRAALALTDQLVVSGSNRIVWISTSDPPDAFPNIEMAMQEP